ncbi:MAG: hypothetical protein K6B18_06145 [Ruminococcus sp.]|nr:hypothetical protein [Ruminococcus sp.]
MKKRRANSRNDTNIMGSKSIATMIIGINERPCALFKSFLFPKSTCISYASLVSAFDTNFAATIGVIKVRIILGINLIIMKHETKAIRLYAVHKNSYFFVFEFNKLKFFIFLP